MDLPTREAAESALYDALNKEIIFAGKTTQEKQEFVTRMLDSLEGVGLRLPTMKWAGYRIRATGLNG